jgi:hypothetical protein
MPDFCQGRDASSHDDGLSFAIENLLDGNRASVASVDNAFIIFHWDKNAPLVEHGPKFTDEVVDLRLLIWEKVGHINLLSQNLFMLRRDEGVVKARVDRTVKVRHRMA